MYADIITPAWFVVKSAGQNPLLVPAQHMHYSSSTDQIYLVTQSLQQRHTFLARLSSLSTNMQISLEHIQHMEGIPESTHYGFIERSHSLLTQATTPLELIQKMPT